jgi:fructosamine-3-kinase
MLLPTDFISHIKNNLSATIGQDVQILTVEKVSGGSVNESYKLSTNSTSFFIKVNSEKKFPGLFDSEEKGLKKLKSTSDFYVPEVIFKGHFNDSGYLILPFLERGETNTNFWNAFAENLAQLHQQSAEYFGFDEDNYNGSLIQVNSKKLRWADFFVENRLMIQCRMARDNNMVDKSFVSQVEKIYPKIEHLFPIEKPSLLHGDLWSGNFMASKNRDTVIFDPAVYYGHREVDLAMSLLFGGFDKQLYKRYNEVFPLEAGWESRVDIANLYPLLVHVNLFGASYAKRVKQVIKPFV